MSVSDKKKNLVSPFQIQVSNPVLASSFREEEKLSELLSRTGSKLGVSECILVKIKKKPSKFLSRTGSKAGICKFC